ncbi:hypothetical protein GCM10017668_12470 [Streptomyces tuirus]|uniref:Uncharacterized protein n=1 Tax=Streptomyces tuirus TaxID=68278 RepID=A0A7G1NCV3_9ACTN|nr:hypothetical protein GCM10017668_12470 [Streptomyces tuirus]
MLVGVPPPGQGAESDPGHTKAGAAEMPLLHERRDYWPEPTVWVAADHGFPGTGTGAGRHDREAVAVYLAPAPALRCPHKARY